ncbi:MAG: hypothetical protein QNL61_08420 [Crocinitomicaceae bacterium]
MKYTSIALILFTALVSCKPKIEAPEASMGDVDASRYIAIGTNNTAGYSNDGLTFNGQDNSYAAIIAKQFSVVATIDFKQPFVSAGSIGFNIDGKSPLKLGNKTDCKGLTSLSPIRIAGAGDMTQLMNQYAGYGPFNNFGVPGMSALSINVAGFGNPANGVGNFNPYFARFTSNEATASVLSDAVAQNPTFFTIMLGDDDILTYAKSGGTNGVIPLANGAAGVGFSGSLEEVITSLNGNGAKGAISNIPDVKEYPYFTTIPYNGLTVDAANAVTLNQIFNPVGISFVVGVNAFIMEDLTAPFGVRKMVEGELVLLSTPLDSVKCNGTGSVFPFRDEFVLDLDEIAEINTKISEYNTVISSLSQTYGLAIADTKLLIHRLKTGTVYNGVSMSSAFVTGGAYSLDGIQLNPNGQALLANTFLEAINLAFSAALPYANPIKYSGIIFP